jgi:TorA maturation chaperone TorD
MDNAYFMMMEQQRADCYRLFSALFYPPDKEAFIEEDVCGGLVKLMESICPDALGCAQELCNALERTAPDVLSIAHAKLFVGPFGLQAPPYGSVYIEESKRLMGNTTIEVMKMYQRAGLSLSDENRDAPDHISIELEFMHYLASKEIQSLNSGDSGGALEFLQTQHVFFDKYLNPWIGPFCDRIRESSEADFYKLLSMCLSIFFKHTPVPGTIQARVEATS